MGVNVDLITLFALGFMVEVREAAALAAVEDGAAADCEGAIGADGKAINVDRVRLYWVIELELLVGDNLTLSVILVGEDTILQNHDGGVCAWCSFLESQCTLC